MEGYMNKWTNYLSGWKPRYFLLSQGVLSYYLTCEEVGAGCRGSVQVIHCRTVSHAYDHCRLDIVLPSKRCIYLKASTPSMRQQWLMSIANAKMECNDKKGDTVWVDRNVEAKRLKDKCSELDTNRQQLMRQISALKDEIEIVAKSKTDELKRVKSLSLLISTTCDTIISTFEDCISITYFISNDSVDGSEPHGSLPTNSPSESPLIRHIPTPLSRPSATPHEVEERTFLSPPPYLQPLESLVRSSSRHGSASTSPSYHVPCGTPITAPTPIPMPLALQSADTLLSSVCRFVGYMVIPSQPGLVQIEAFLDTCNEIPELVVQTFGSMSGPLKSDILGNIAKIQAKHNALHREFPTLQELVLSEIERDEHKDDKSATVGLLWLKRCLHFLQVYFHRFSVDNMELGRAIVSAYEASLMPYHNFVVRSLFSFLLRHSGTRESILLCLGKKDESRVHLVLEQMRFISQELLKAIVIIDEFYLANDLR